MIEKDVFLTIPIVWHRLILMGKLLDDGNTLYKKQRLQESTQRFQYALKKFPPVEDYGGPEYQAAFQHLRIHLTLNLARCKRKMGVSLQILHKFQLNCICVLF